MSWVCSLSHQAAKDLRALPRERQVQVAEAIDEMGRNPTLGDVRPIKSGKFLRVTVGTQAENDRLLEALDDIVPGGVRT